MQRTTFMKICGGALRLALPLVAALPAILCQPVSARVVGAIAGYDQSDETKLPKLLSQTGLYDNVASKNRKFTAGIVAYDVNAPLWSDGAHKTRFIQLPAGKTVSPTDSDHYQFPDSTVFIKNFAFDTVYGDTTTRILHETRMLIVRVIAPDTVTIGITYKWNRKNTEAELVSTSSGLDTAFIVKWGNEEVAKRWTYPSTNTCAQCHQPGRNVLGFLTPQLNRGGSGANNQLAKLVTAGILKSNPIATKPSIANFAWHGASETGVSDSVKARSYFASNCSQCHGNGHIELEGASHDFDWFTANKNFRFRPQVMDTAGHVTDPGNPGPVGKLSSEQKYPMIIYPGYPESSYVMRRMMSRGDLNGPSLYQMPPLATFQIDSAGVTMMKNFICSLGKRGAACQFPDPADQQADASFWMHKNSDDVTFGPWAPNTGVFPHKFSRQMYGFRAILNGRTLLLEGRALRLKVSMFDYRGREVPLTYVRPSEYRIEGSLTPGVYFVKSGRDMAKVNVLP